jgi:hypothetical protein
MLKAGGWYDGYWNHWRTMFPYSQQHGLHILPVHYYSPIPDTRALSDELWKDLRWPTGFDLRLNGALAWLGSLGAKYKDEFNKLFAQAASGVHAFDRDNPAFTPGDAEILYSILREIKPHKIIEIGSGHSTLLMCQAIRANRNEASDYCCDFVAIEPYPPAYLCPPPPEVTRLEPKRIQDVDPALFFSLKNGDILFIDSSHVVRTGSDVVHEFLRILPDLAPGVIVHVHDIFMPAEYPRAWLREECIFWNEQYLLEAFLTSNRDFEVIMPAQALWRLHPDAFSNAFQGFKAGHVGPSSFWIRRTQSASSP